MNTINAELQRFTIDGHMVEQRTMVQWWRLDTTDAGQLIGRTFTIHESTQLVQWMDKRKENFPSKPSISFGQTPDEEPDISELLQMGLPPFEPPMFVILKKEPKLLKNEVNFAMDIKLKPVHEYDLPFDIVGELNP